VTLAHCRKARPLSIPLVAPVPRPVPGLSGDRRPTAGVREVASKSRDSRWCARADPGGRNDLEASGRASCGAYMFAVRSIRQGGLFSHGVRTGSCSEWRATAQSGRGGEPLGAAARFSVARERACLRRLARLAAGSV